MSAQVLAIFLWAMSQVETGGNPHAVGAAKERTQWQITPAVRAQYPAEWSDRQVAEAHVRHLEAHLRRHGLQPTARNLALAWNAGPTATVRRRASASAKDHAERVANLFHERLNQ